MNNYPNINGLQIDMTLNEVKHITQFLDHGVFKLTLDNQYFLESKHSEFIAMFSFFVDNNNHLTQFEILDWREFFEFKNNINFKNVLEIMHDYYLKKYECYSRDQNRNYVLESYNGFDFIFDSWKEIISFNKKD